MGLAQLINRRNTLIFSTAALASSWLAVRWRQQSQDELNKKSFHVDPTRSGTFFSPSFHPTSSYFHWGVAGNSPLGKNA
ncbi:hypothetical protein D0859_01354 [Hortaea werneckii]|uniref:Uncharacterized protein n=1 Tax=Hortaea werneckii TaxID=91943 RepID=A0A3M7J9W5_HORWE|nr:hypothetical protein D0859_01354 [Hortaea werneckii]